MHTFVKAQTASVIATVFDFLITVFAVEVLGIWYVSASVWGTVSGGGIHFLLSRSWVFPPSSSRILPQLIKYFITWTGSFLLNAAGVFVITHYLGVSYVFSKVISSVMIGVGYNYIFQKKFVFR